MEKTKEEAALLLERWKEFHPASFETMVNKIATALNNRDVELERVRGLLQRYGRHEEGCEYREALCSQPTCGEMHVTPCTCGLGAESADIGKLETAEQTKEKPMTYTRSNHASMTEPFDKLSDHLQDCCGGCPYCVELCQQVVDEANAKTS